MGMYTELHFNAELLPETPAHIIETLEYMLDNSKPIPTMLDHELFSASRWSYMLKCDSYYFDADTHSTLRFDDISDSYFLCIRCNLKNYDQEISKFISWIMPFIDAEPGDFIGFYRYEESNEPTLIYKD